MLESLENRIAMNAAPVAFDDGPFTVHHDQFLNVSAVNGVLLNDTDADNDTLTADVVNYPTNGYVMMMSDGSFYYTPNPGFVGQDSFTNRAFDGTAYSNSATVTLSVTNQAPVAVGDSYSIHQGQFLNVNAPGLLANDSDPDNDSLSVQIVSYPTNGYVKANSDGSFYYWPNSGFVGQDSFTYRVFDGAAYSNTETVSIAVTYQAPVAVGDSYGIHQGQFLNVNAPGLLANDSDPDNDSLTMQIVTYPTNGYVMPNSDGSFYYSPNSGFVGQDSFTYRVFDGAAYSNTATVAITVTNQAPVAVADSYSIHQGQFLNVNAPGLLANDSDLDNDSLTVEIVTYPTNGYVMPNSDGSFYYSPNSGFAGQDSFTYRAFDGAAYSNTASVAITVTNQAPVAVGDSYGIHQGQFLNVNAPGLLGNDSDPDNDQLSVQIVSYPTNGYVMTNSNGSFYYTPYSGFAGQDTFTYRVFDGAAYSNTATVTITVTNQAPVAVPDSYSVHQGQFLNVNAPGLLANDSDPDNDSLIVQVVTYPTNGYLTANADGSFYYSPNMGFAGQDNFSYRAFDGSAYSDIATVTTTVTNQSPVADDGSFWVLFDETYFGSLVASDPDQDALTFSIASYPSFGYLSLDSSTGAFSYTPNSPPVGPAYTGPDSFTFRVFDGQAYSTSATVSVSITGSPPPPQSALFQFSTWDLPFSESVGSVTLRVERSDTSGTATVSYQTSDFTAFSGGDYQFATGTLFFEDSQEFAYITLAIVNDLDSESDEEFQVSLSNPSPGYAIGLVGVHTLAILDNDSPPDATNLSFQVKANDQSLSHSIMDDLLAGFYDPDNRTLSAEVLSQPVNGLLTWNSDGNFNYTPNSLFVGIDTFTYRVFNTLAHSSIFEVAIHVLDETPAGTPDHYWFGAGTVFVAAEPGVLINDQDIDDFRNLVAVLHTGPQHGILAFQQDGSFTYTRDIGFTGQDSFTYRPYDGVVYGDVTQVTLYLQNEAPQSAEDDYYVWANGSLSISDTGVLRNDYDLDSHSLEAQLLTGPQYGEAFFFNADGTFSYTPLATMPPGQTIDSFVYRAFDGYEYGNPVAVTLHVTSVPVGLEDAYLLDEQNSITVAQAAGVLANDFGNLNNSLQAQLVDGIDPAIGTLALQASGAFSFTPGPQFDGFATFRYAPLLPTGAGDPVTVTLHALQTVFRQSISVQTVSFDPRYGIPIRRDSAGPNFNTPYDDRTHWYDRNGNGVLTDPGDFKSPLAIKADTGLQANVTFLLNPAFRTLWQGNDLRIRAIGPDGIVVDKNADGQPVLGQFLFIAGEYWIRSTSALQFAPFWKVSYLDNFSVQWEVSPDGGGTWITPATGSTTTNDIYVTWGDPLLGLPLFESSLWNATLGAANINVLQSNIEVIDAVFSRFLNQDIRKRDGTPLRYYGDWRTTALDTESLLRTGDGQCGAWSFFFFTCYIPLAFETSTRPSPAPGAHSFPRLANTRTKPFSSMNGAFRRSRIYRRRSDSLCSNWKEAVLDKPIFSRSILVH